MGHTEVKFLTVISRANEIDQSFKVQTFKCPDL